jgi:glycosyltransferase involved in cell wall biosynthesis
MSNNRHADVILFSSADWQSRYWTNKQHIATRLAARGHRVLYVETVGLRLPGLNGLDAKRIISRLKRGLSPVAQVRKNLWTLSPLTIPLAHRNPAVAAINSWQLRTRIKKWISANDVQTPLVWTYHPYMLDAIELLDVSTLVYHCVDDLGAMPGIDRESFEIAERKLLDRADITFTTSHFLQARCATIAGPRAHYFCNVADVAHFGKARAAGVLPPELESIPRPRLCYLGALSDFKVDFELLDKIAGARPNWQFVFVGEEPAGQFNTRLAQLAKRPNVHLLGWRPYADLPQYLRGFDVALLPQLINDYTRAMFPMKFFEYLAAGLPVVSTPTEALVDFNSIHSIAPDAESFAGAIQTLLGSKSKPLPLDCRVLQDNSWDSRLDRMLAAINGHGQADRSSSSILNFAQPDIIIRRTAEPSSGYNVEL